MILKAFKDMEFQKISPRWGFISAVNFFITKISLLRSADAAVEQQSQRDVIFVIKKIRWYLSHIVTI